VAFDLLELCPSLSLAFSFLVSCIFPIHIFGYIDFFVVFIHEITHTELAYRYVDSILPRIPNIVSKIGHMLYCPLRG
jgi:hypothetical protein